MAAIVATVGPTMAGVTAPNSSIPFSGHLWPSLHHNRMQNVKDVSIVEVMDTKFIEAPKPKPLPFSPIKIMKADAAAAAVQVRHDKTIRFGESQSRSCTTCGLLSSIKAVENNSDEVMAQEREEAQQEENLNVSQIKQHLFAALQGINRGIFGVPSAKKSEIENLVELLESKNPTPQPTLCLEKVAGAWKLIYSTISILGSKRTKLGLRDFINLGDFIQMINVAQGKAVNVIEFSAKGLTLLSGQLTIDASFKIVSNSRVDISYQKSVITPDQLMNVFRKNYDLLLQIFNPDGWLEITYVDDSLRIGRDDKGNIFILERIKIC